MNISIANILPPPAAQPPPAPAPQDSSDSSPTSGFSQQLNRAKSKPSQSAEPRQIARPSGPAASADAKKTQSGSTLDKDKSKNQQKQQNPADASAETEGESQVQSETAGSGDSDQANLAEGAQNAQPVIRAKVPALASIQGIPQTVQDSNSPQASTKTVSAKSDQPTAQPDPTDDLVNQQAVAGTQQAAAPGKNAPEDNSGAEADEAADSVNLKQAGPNVSVSPFKAENSTSNAGTASPGASTGAATDATGQSSAEMEADLQTAAKDKTAGDAAGPSVFAQLLPAAVPSGSTVVSQVQHAAPVVQTPVAQFAETNQPSIVSTIHGSLLPDGGTMSITLNPPDLGAMQITVKMENGAMSASFQTSSDQATRLLTRTLGQLKDALETQGVTVDRLHVHQVSKSDESSGQGKDAEGNGKETFSDGKSAQQEQQRRETLRRMWRRVRGERDPLDLVA